MISPRQVTQRTPAAAHHFARRSPLPSLPYRLAAQPVAIADRPRHIAYLARETMLKHDLEGWLGRIVLDRGRRRLGRIVDLLVEERSLEETVEHGGGMHAWAVRPLFAVIKVRSWLLTRTIFVPVAEIVEDGKALLCPRDGDYVTRLLRWPVADWDPLFARGL